MQKEEVLLFKFNPWLFLLPKTFKLLGFLIFWHLVYPSEKSIVSMETKITKHEKERSINDKNNSEKGIVYMETKITKHEKERSNNDKNNSEKRLFPYSI